MEFKLAIGAAAVNLNGFFRNAEFCSDFFIGITLCHHADHFAFALRELLETGLEICDFGLIAAVGFIAGDGSFNHINETRFLRRFFQKVESAVLHGIHRHVDVGVTGNKDDRQIAADLFQLILQLKSGHVGHAHVEQNASGTTEIVGRKERVSIAEFDAFIVLARQ